MTKQWKATWRGAAAASVLALGLGAASAQDGDAKPAGGHSDERGGPPHRRPPPEAFSACQGKSEGAQCTVSFHDKTHDGVCVAPGKEELFCMPNDMPPPPPRE
jgi:hypothetical protein